MTSFQLPAGQKWFGQKWFTSQRRSETNRGKIKISNHSSLRKLMRAARKQRGIMEQHLGIIEDATKRAQQRAHVYKNRRHEKP